MDEQSRWNAKMHIRTSSRGDKLIGLTRESTSTTRNALLQLSAFCFRMVAAFLSTSCRLAIQPPIFPWLVLQVAIHLGQSIVGRFLYLKRQTSSTKVSEDQ
jgi:hypothetical protein